MRKQALAWSPSGLADVHRSTIQVPATELLTARLPISGIGLAWLLANRRGLLCVS